MMFDGSLAVIGIRFLRRRALREDLKLAVDFDLRSENSSVADNPSKSGGIWPTGLSVHLILAMRGLSQIIPLVVRLYFVAVVNLMLRPTAGFQIPGDAVCRVKHLVNPDNYVAPGAFATSNGPRAHSPSALAAWRTFLPDQNPSFTIVGQHGAQRVNWHRSRTSVTASVLSWFGHALAYTSTGVGCNNLVAGALYSGC